ncbi:hypothetical protein [Trinickia mobilis]|uniref:hypothetical protein n=1 Tax=Trinickia mobilis TaxID=2816356 RepID=UPI001A8EC6DF|nr:hypothetical protein [Trinickia mobilis]
MTMIDGPKLTIGDREFTVAPATIGAVKRQMAGYRDHPVGDPARFDVSMQFILETLQRNHPDLDMEFLDQWLDMRNLSSVMQTIQSASGFETKKDDAPGETPAA